MINIRKALYKTEKLCYNDMSKNSCFGKECDILDKQRIFCCFTGHRKIPSERIPELAEKLNLELQWMIAHDICDFMTGGALGFDTLAALAVLKAKRENENVRLHLIIPCTNQTRNWSEHDISVYEWIRERADRVEILSDHYHPGVMQIRNRYMVDHSDYCICYFDTEANVGKKTGGTLYTCNYALKKGRRLINLFDSNPPSSVPEFGD